MRKPKPIVVHCHVWEPWKWFRFQGRTYRVKFIREAREILEAHGRTIVCGPYSTRK